MCQNLGYVVGQGQVVPPAAKMQAILKFPASQNNGVIQRYLGMVGYCHGFIKGFSKITTPFTDFLKRVEGLFGTKNVRRPSNQLKISSLRIPFFVLLTLISHSE